LTVCVCVSVCVCVCVCVCQSVLKVMESLHSWDAFRRAGGFTGLLSLAVDMEGALSDPPRGPVWDCLDPQDSLGILLATLQILALAVYLHPVNAHFFQTGGFYEKLADALLQLGCFQREEEEEEEEEEEQRDRSIVEGSSSSNTSAAAAAAAGTTAEYKPSHGMSFHKFVELAETPASSSSSSSSVALPPTLRTCLRLLSYLDQFATGTYCAPALLNSPPPPPPETEAKPDGGERRRSRRREAEEEGVAVNGHSASDVQRRRADESGAGRAVRHAPLGVSAACGSESQLRCVCV